MLVAQSATETFNANSCDTFSLLLLLLLLLLYKRGNKYVFVYVSAAFARMLMAAAVQDVLVV